MILPIQTAPTMRNASEAKISGMMAGINPANLACDLCCSLLGGRGTGVCRIIRGCRCH